MNSMEAKLEEVKTLYIKSRPDFGQYRDDHWKIKPLIELVEMLVEKINSLECEEKTCHAKVLRLR
jgi:hypothetical protein